MENLIPKIEKTLQAELSNFLSLGAILTKVEQETPWHEAGMTKGQWLAGEAGLPIITANQAKDAYLLLRDIDSSLVKKLTVGKLKLILPQLKRAEGQDEEEKELKFVGNSFGSYEVISTTYYEEYAKCTILVLNNQTGEIKSKKFKLKW